MTWTLLASNKSVDPNNFTAPYNSVGASFMLAAISFDSILPISDNVGNTGNYLNGGFLDDAAAIAMYYVQNPGTGSSTVISESGFPHHCGVVGAAFSGRNALSTTATTTSGNTQVTTLTLPSLTPTSSDMLAIVGIATRPDRVTSAFNVPGFTEIQTVNTNGDNLYACSIWYKAAPTSSVALAAVPTWLGAVSATAAFSLFGPAINVEVATRNGVVVFPSPVVATLNGITLTSVQLLNGFRPNP